MKTLIHLPNPHVSGELVEIDITKCKMTLNAFSISFRDSDGQSVYSINVSKSRELYCNALVLIGRAMASDPLAFMTHAQMWERP
jgi:hypothetical protein